jgi:hypothetical protein
MKNGFWVLIWMLPVVALTAACSPDTSQPPANQPQGPALVMFYTEG